MQDIIEWQRNAIEQGQRTVEQSLDVQRSMTESLWRNNLGTGHTIQDQQTALVRNWTDAFFGAMGTFMPREETEQMRKSLHDQFDELSHAQDEAWNAFQESVDEAMDAYDDLTESQKQVLDRSVKSYMEVQENVGEEMAHATEEMGRQVREIGHRQEERAHHEESSTRSGESE